LKRSGTTCESGFRIISSGAADAHKRVEVDHLAYELSNDLWDSAAGNRKIKNKQWNRQRITGPLR
jgi:hypothetical protein